MGVGGNFWDILKPYARTEGFDFLRNKRVAIDLSYWIVQHETAIKVHTRNPHLRLTFFRTINLFSKFGAFPVFVTDGTPSPLKSHARMMRFFQASGIDIATLPISNGTSVERNKKFSKCVQECVELLELIGMPVLKASGEAEGLCAQLNREGRVDACITSDSDAFLFGAKSIIKHINPNSQEPFEWYDMSDIEVGLGLKRKHLIGIGLLVGNDFDLKGVQGIGIETALSFVKSFNEDEVLDRLCLLGSGNMLPMGYKGVSVHNLDENTTKIKLCHCSLCGHPGSKRSHLKDSCQICNSSKDEGGCLQKPIGFKCSCSSCHQDKKEKEQKKNEAWKMRVCNKIANEPNFPNNEIIEMYLNNNHTNFTDAEPFISWKNPNTEMLIDYISYNLNWEPSFTRQKLFPLLSTIFLRNKAKNQETDLLLYGQYTFDLIQRTKIRFGHMFYVVTWSKHGQIVNNHIPSTPLEDSQVLEDDESVNNVCVDNGCLMTDENMDLVMSAYPQKVNQFIQQKESKKKGKSKSTLTPENSSKSVQLNITEYYRSSKGESIDNLKENHSSTVKRNVTRGNLSKSVRRRLLFE